MWADRTSTTVEYPANYDGKDYPIIGSMPVGADAIAIKKIDANTI